VAIALMCVSIGMLVLIGQERLAELAREEKSSDGRAHLFDHGMNLFLWISDSLRTSLVKSRANVRLARRFLCLPEGSYFGFFAEDKCWCSMDTISHEWIPYAFGGEWFRLAIARFVNVVPSLETINSAWVSFAISCTGASHAVLSALFRLSTVLIALLLQATLPMLVWSCRSWLNENRNSKKWKDKLDKAMPKLEQFAWLAEYILVTLWVLTALQIGVLWLSNRLKEGNFSPFCKALHNSHIKPCFHRFVALIVLDVYHTTVCLSWSECDKKLQWIWQSPQHSTTQMMSTPPLAWLAVAPPMYIFWEAVVLSHPPRGDISIIIVLECTCRVLHRSSRLANKLSHPAKALMFDEILHVLSRAPLELFYAALVSSYWVHMFMPGGCIPAAALLVFFPLSLLRGVAAWFNLGLDAKRRVMPDFQDGPGTIWVCNWWIQGFLFFFFTRTQLQHFIEANQARAHSPERDTFMDELAKELRG
jgi:hypothetical protein